MTQTVSTGKRYSAILNVEPAEVHTQCACTIKFSGVNQMIMNSRAAKHRKRERERETWEKKNTT